MTIGAQDDAFLDLRKRLLPPPGDRNAAPDGETLIPKVVKVKDYRVCLPTLDTAVRFVGSYPVSYTHLTLPTSDLV